MGVHNLHTPLNSGYDSAVNTPKHHNNFNAGVAPAFAVRFKFPDAPTCMRFASILNCIEPVFGGAQNKRECSTLTIVSDSNSHCLLLRQAHANSRTGEGTAGEGERGVVLSLALHSKPKVVEKYNRERGKQHGFLHLRLARYDVAKEGEKRETKTARIFSRKNRLMKALCRCVTARDIHKNSTARVAYLELVRPPQKNTYLKLRRDKAPTIQASSFAIFAITSRNV